VLEGELANAPLGTTVTIRIPDAPPSAQAALRVPVGALLETGKGSGVWVVSGEPAKVTWRPVTIHRIDDDSARVAGSLKQGDRIVALGAHLLREGESVRTAGQAVAAANPGARP
jgi:multidrug efflux pump subunit AcrA (membrane-fusion protein)